MRITICNTSEGIMINKCVILLKITKCRHLRDNAFLFSFDFGVKSNLGMFFMIHPYIWNIFIEKTKNKSCVILWKAKRSKNICDWGKHWVQVYLLIFIWTVFFVLQRLLEHWTNRKVWMFFFFFLATFDMIFYIQHRP